VMITLVFAGPTVGMKLLILGSTLKLLRLVAVAPAVVVTLILPVVASAGTMAVIEVADTTVKLVAAVPLNLTAVAPVKFVPVIVTVAPILPLSGVNELMVGSLITVKLAAL